MKKYVALRMGCALCALSLIGACAPKSDVDALQSRVRHQDQQLQQLQPVQADTWAQMQAIRQEVASLRGQMEDLQSAGGARVLAEKVNKHDAALRQVESSLALNFSLDSPGGGHSLTDGGFNQGGGAHNTFPGGQEHQNSVLQTEPGRFGDVPLAPAVQAPPKDTATALYEAGVNSYKNRSYQEALRSFTDFTKTYPNHKLASNAWFEAGESNFQLNRFADAALAYDTVITKYGSSQKVPGAYLKQGIAFSKLGQKEAANARLKELIRKFPNSPEASRAKQIMQQNK